jgi:hypothetical protein
MPDRMKRDTIWRRMIDIDSDIWPRRVKGRTEDVIEGLRGTSAVLKQPNSESSLDRGVSGASHFPGVRGTKLLYSTKTLFSLPPLLSPQGRYKVPEGEKIPDEFLWRYATVATVSNGISRPHFLHFVVRYFLGCTWFDFSFPEWRSVPDKDTRVPAGRASRRLTLAGNAPESVCLTTLTPQDQKGRLDKNQRWMAGCLGKS